MRKTYLILYLIAANLQGIAQKEPENITGRISFISSQNVYVKFSSTDGISAGDTLMLPAENKMIPVLIVRNLSSTSCVCYNISDISLTTDHLIVAKKRNGLTESEENTVAADSAKPIPVVRDNLTGIAPAAEKKKYKITGTISANSYSDFSGTAASDLQRFRYTFSLNARHSEESGFQFNSYISFKHETGNPAAIKENIFNALKIYSLSAGYDIGNSLHLALGRKINPKISNIGSVDGFQAEKSFGKFTMGTVAGSRPDYSDYGFNFSLFQFGGYVSYETRSTNWYSSTSIAFMEQMNKQKTDRRFLYFQQSGRFLKYFYLLGTFEIDLYKLENNLPINTFDLTGAYLSLRYMVKKFNVSGSYDARRNVIYYETFKTYIDRILDTGTRQGYRLDASYRLTDKIILGMRSGYRFMKSDPRPSGNLGGYLTISQIPVLNISATLRGTYLRANYMNGFTAGVELSGDYLQGKLQAFAGYHLSDFTLPENSVSVIQNTGETGLSLLLSRNLFAGVNYEVTLEETDLYNRIYLQMRYRF
ncbi:MAG: hypothetical protein V1903_05075 [Bacteroidota bacterium]